MVYRRDGATAYVFGRDGAPLTKSLLSRSVEGRVQAGRQQHRRRDLGRRQVGRGAELQPGGIGSSTRPPRARRRHPGHLRRARRAGKRSRVVGLAELPGQRFIYPLRRRPIWIADLSQPGEPKLTKFTNVGHQPTTPGHADGRFPSPGCSGRAGDDRLVGRRADGSAHPRTWPRSAAAAGGKMPHLRGWAVAGRHAWLPLAIGRHEVLVVDTESWAEVAFAIPVAGQPVFVMARARRSAGGSTSRFPTPPRAGPSTRRRDRVVNASRPGAAVLLWSSRPGARRSGSRRATPTASR